MTQDYRALPLVQHPKRTAIKAAVMYYGAAEVTAFRRDLPLLMVRAGLDRPPLNRAMTEGDADAAIAWLKSIPQRFLPRDVEKDPVFAPIQARPEFKALFQAGQ